MYKYNQERDGIYIVVNGEEYKLQYGSNSIGTAPSKCSKCDFFNGSCGANESCRRIESQFPDSYWKLTCPRYVLCDGTSSKYAYAFNSFDSSTAGFVTYTGSNKNFQGVTYTVGGTEFSATVDFSNGD